MQLPSRAGPADDNMSLCKTEEIFKELPNVFGIAEDILILGHDADGKEHDNNIEIYCKENLKLNK